MTNDQLIAIMPTASVRFRADSFLLWLNQFMPQFDIVGKLREAAFLATVAEESGELRYTRELWGPTEQQQGYEGRADLGNTEPGDGPKFRGRGLIQITGRSNYQAAQDALGVKYVDQPELMQSSTEATRTACWWWQAHGCNELADIPDFKAVTRRVNGGLTHFDRRLAYYNSAMGAIT
jgi:putative chitinase